MIFLHITDFHFSKETKFQAEQIRLVDSFIDILRKNNVKVDCVFFTGDLVYSGENLQDFFDAKSIFLDKISNQLNIDSSNVFICPGNHDVFRNQELDGINMIVQDLSDNDQVNDFVTKQNKKSLIASLENLVNYNAFQNDFYKTHIEKHGDQLIDGMFTTHIREIDGKKVAITTINSAWRAIDSKTDSGNLLFPISYLHQAYEKIKDCDLKVLLMHHPISDFKYWNAQKMEDSIFKDFHVLFSGHTHHKKNTLHITPNIGIYHCTSPAALSFEKEANIGFTLLGVEAETFELEIQNFIYEKHDEIFYAGEKIPAQIPVNVEKQNQNKFRKTVRKRFDEKLEEANKLFLSYKEKKNEDNFFKLFTNPVIKSESQTGPQKAMEKNYELAEIENCSDTNYLIFGRDKSGKSALLYKILLDNLNEYSLNNCLPIYIDCRNYIKATRPIDIIDELKNFYELNRHDAEELSKKYHIRILLDNVRQNEKMVLEPIEKFAKENEKVTIVATASETILTSFGQGSTYSLVFKNIFIHDITRKEIRLLTEKWPNITSAQREVLLEKIQVVFKQLNIPSNYWTVSLFIWIFEKNSNLNLGSNFQLIELYIDNLLDKHNFILSTEYKIDFEDLKNYLAELSHELVTKHTSSNYQIDYTELVNFTSRYKKQNKRFVIDVEDIISLVLEKGILKKLHDRYTFRLNGVFEFFIGHYMNLDSDFRKKVVDDDNFYLSFGNELEICAGMLMYDFEYVQSIFHKTKNIFNSVNSKYDKYNMDYYLLQKVGDKLKIDIDLNDVLKTTISNPMPIEKQDVVFEEVNPSTSRMSEVQAKKFYQCIESDSEHLEKALFILARVFRNSKLRNQEKFNNEVFDFVLDSTVTLGFTLMDEVDENKDQFVTPNISEEDLMKLLTKFIPIIMQTFFYDALVQINMEDIIKEKIVELKKTPKGNELKLLILYFSLIDLDLKNNEQYIEEVIQLLKIPILKNTSLLKLYIYLSLKVNGNKPLEQRIKQYIKDQELKLNSKKNKGLIEQGISKLQKSKYFNRRKK